MVAAVTVTPLRTAGGSAMLLGVPPGSSPPPQAASAAPRSACSRQPGELAQEMRLPDSNPRRTNAPTPSHRLRSAASLSMVLCPSPVPSIPAGCIPASPVNAAPHLRVPERGILDRAETGGGLACAPPGLLRLLPMVTVAPWTVKETQEHLQRCAIHTACVAEKIEKQRVVRFRFRVAHGIG